MARDRVLCSNGQSTTPFQVDVYFVNGENSNGVGVGDIIHLDIDMRFRVLNVGTMVGWSQKNVQVEDLDGYGGAPDGTGAYYTPTSRFKLSQAPSFDVEITQPLLHAMQVRDNQAIDAAMPTNGTDLNRISVVNGKPLLDGMPWPSLDTLTFIAGESLPAHTIVRLGPDGYVYRANNTESDQAQFVMGILTEAVTEAQSARVVRSGVWTCTDTLTRGPLFLGDMGQLTSTVPSSTEGAMFLKQVGVAVGEHQYLIELHDTIILA